MGGQQLSALDLGHRVAVRLEEVGHRRLRVDDDVARAGEVDDRVGTHRRAVAADARHLLVEVAAGDEARELEHAPQLHLAPGAADRGGVEGTREGRRLGAERLGGAAHLGQALTELAELERPVALERPDLSLDPADRVAQRGEQGGRRVVEVARGLEVETRSRSTSRSASAPADRARRAERAESQASSPPTSAPMTSPTSRAVRSMPAPSQMPPTPWDATPDHGTRHPTRGTWRTAYARVGGASGRSVTPSP